MHIFKLSEFRSTSGSYWYYFEKDSVAKVGNSWWMPAEVLGMKKDEYVKWLIDNYHPTDISFKNTLICRCDDEHDSDMHKYVLYVNKIAKEKKFYVDWG